MKRSLGAKTIVYPTPVLIVGTYDKAGMPNAMNVAWGGALLFKSAQYCYFPQKSHVNVNSPIRLK